MGAISAIACSVGAIVFVDGSQPFGALPVADDLTTIDVLATVDHEFLMHAGRGIGYCYLSRATQDRFEPVNAAWKAERVPIESFFGPTMDLSYRVARRQLDELDCDRKRSSAGAHRFVVRGHLEWLAG